MLLALYTAYIIGSRLDVYQNWLPMSLAILMAIILGRAAWKMK